MITEPIFVGFGQSDRWVSRLGRHFILNLSKLRSSLCSGRRVMTALKTELGFNIPGFEIAQSPTLKVAAIAHKLLRAARDPM